MKYTHVVPILYIFQIQFFDKMPRSKEQNTAKSKSRRRQEENDKRVNEEEREDDLEDIGKTLHAKEGRLGFVTGKGFVTATNFLVDIRAQVHSTKCSIKGKDNFNKCI